MSQSRLWDVSPPRVGSHTLYDGRWVLVAFPGMQRAKDTFRQGRGTFARWNERWESLCLLRNDMDAVKIHRPRTQLHEPSVNMHASHTSCDISPLSELADQCVLDDPYMLAGPGVSADQDLARVRTESSHSCHSLASDRDADSQSTAPLLDWNQFSVRGSPSNVEFVPVPSFIPNKCRKLDLEDVKEEPSE